MRAGSAAVVWVVFFGFVVPVVGVVLLFLWVVLFVVVLFDVFVVVVVMVVYAVVASGVVGGGCAVDVNGTGVDFPVDFAVGRDGNWE